MNINAISANTVSTNLQQTNFKYSNFKGKQQCGKIFTCPNISSKLKNLNENGRAALALGGYVLSAGILAPLLFCAPLITVPLVVGGMVLTVPKVSEWVETGKMGAYFNKHKNHVSTQKRTHNTHCNAKRNYHK